MNKILKFLGIPEVSVVGFWGGWNPGGCALLLGNEDSAKEDLNSMFEISE